MNNQDSVRPDLDHTITRRKFIGTTAFGSAALSPEGSLHWFHDLLQAHMILTLLKRRFPSFRPLWLPDSSQAKIW